MKLGYRISPPGINDFEIFSVTSAGNSVYRYQLCRIPVHGMAQTLQFATIYPLLLSQALQIVFIIGTTYSSYEGSSTCINSAKV